jgi:hypothetical protein
VKTFKSLVCIRYKTFSVIAGDKLRHHFIKYLFGLTVSLNKYRNNIAMQLSVVVKFYAMSDGICVVCISFQCNLCSMDTAYLE